MGMINSPNLVRDGLVLHLDAASTRSYPGTGTIWYDVSGNGNHGTLTNGPSFSSSVISFDGTNDYTNIPSSSSLLFGSQVSFTICCFFKRNSLTVVGNSTIIGFNGDARIWFGVMDESSRLGYLYCNTYYGASGDYWQMASINHKDLNYHYLCMVHDKTNLYQRIFYDGVQTDNVTLASAFPNSSSNFTIGCLNNGYRHSNVTVGAVKIYRKALSNDEILQNYNALKSRFGLT